MGEIIDFPGSSSADADLRDKPVRARTPAEQRFINGLAQLWVDAEPDFGAEGVADRTIEFVTRMLAQEQIKARA